MTQPRTICLGVFFVGLTLLLPGRVAAQPGAPRYIFNRADLPLSEQPVAVIPGDFNGDGRVDLAVAYRSSGRISLLLGNPDGTFQPAIDIAAINTAGFQGTLFGPWSMVAADLNGDGKLDLAIVNPECLANPCPAFWVLLGNGDGTFQALSAVGQSGGPEISAPLIAGDFDGDGKTDIVVLEGANLTIFLGNGDGTFRPGQNFGFGTLGGCASTQISCGVLAVADLNFDGKLDIIVSGTFSNLVTIFMGNGDGTFQMKGTFPTGQNPTGVAVADLNDDGKLDLITANNGSFTVSVLLGNGDGTFQKNVDYLVAQDFLTGSPTSVIAADFNGDGKTDVAVTLAPSANVATVAILFGRGDGTLQSSASYGVSENATGLAAADLNGDGQLDLAVAGSSAISILLAAGQGSFSTESKFAAGLSPQILTAADFNGDGKLDLLVGPQPNSFSSSAVLLGNGDGTFQAAKISNAVGSASAFAVADFNGDNKLDLVTAGSLQFFLGNGDGTFTFFGSGTNAGPQLQPQPIGNTIAVVAGDFNKDGKPDFAVTVRNNGSCTLAIYLGNGDGTFNAPVCYLTSTLFPIGLVAGDFNGDGNLDLAFADQRTAIVSVLLGNGDGTFQPHKDFSTGTPVWALAAGDLRSVGKLDLLALTLGGANPALAVLLGNGDGTFQPYSDFPVPFTFHPQSIITGDFDADGKLDVAFDFQETNNFVILLGNGDGTLQAPLSFLSASNNGTASPSAPATAAGDFTATGTLGLASLGSNTNTVDVFLERPILSAFPTTVVFQPQAVGSTSPAQTVTIYNPGVVKLNISRIDKTGDFSETNTCTSGPVLPGANCTISVSFTPSTTGVRTGTLVLTDDAGTSPQTIKLTTTPEPTTTSLATSGTPSVFGQSVTITATVTSSAGDIPTGNLTFMDGGSAVATILLTNGTASFASSSLTVGTHSFKATYAPDSGLQPSSSAVLTQVVNPGGTAITISCGSGTGLQVVIRAGDPVPCTATVTVVSPAAGTPTQNVTFFDAGTSIGTAPLVLTATGALTATLNPSFSSAGTHLITAQYAGDTNFTGSTTSVPYSLAISAISTTLTLSCQPPPTQSQPIVGQSVQCGANAAFSDRYAPSIPTGTVTFFDGGTSIGTAQLNNTNPAGGPAVFTTPAFMSAGQHSLTASYAGDNAFGGSSTASPTTISVLQDSVSLGPLNPSQGTPFAGSPVTFTVQLSIFQPAGASSLPQIMGSVTFSDGANVLGSTPVNASTPIINGSLVVSFTASFAPGLHTVSATYSGDANYLASGPVTLSLGVRQVPTTIALASTTNSPSQFGQSVILIATVGPQGGPLAPTQNVAFFDGATQLGTAPLTGATASFNATGLAVGSHSFTASYLGDTNFSASGPSAPPLPWTVLNPTTTTVLKSSLNPSIYGQTVTFTVTVSSGAGMPPGNVMLSDGSNSLGSATLNSSGVGTFSTSLLTVGTHSITASYPATGIFLASTSAAVMQTVTPAPLVVTVNSTSRQYGQANPPFSGTISGLQNGDNITATYSTTATQASPVGNYPITDPLIDPNGKLPNYTVTVNNGTLTVTPALLTIAANNASRGYGANNPAFNGLVSGVQNSDNISATYATSATPASPVGSYFIVPSAVDPTNKLGNYTVSLVNGTLTVTPVTLTITAPNVTKILNAPLPSSFTPTYSGFVNGDGPASLNGSLNCTTNATASSPVGNYVITCTGSTSTNYSIVYKSGTLTIIYQPGGTCDGDLNHQILQPINADGTSVWKQGRTIPAKFRACDANGVSIGTPGLVTSFYLVQVIAGTVTSVDETVASTTPDTAFRWDPTGQQWIFNISTTNLPANQTYVYVITLNDGSAIKFQYGLR